MIFGPVKDVKEVITWWYMHVIQFWSTGFSSKSKILSQNKIFVIELNFWSNFKFSNIHSWSYFESGPKVYIWTVWNWTKSRIQSQDLQFRRKPLDQTLYGLHMPSRDYLILLLFWTKTDTSPKISIILIRIRDSRIARSGVYRSEISHFFGPGPVWIRFCPWIPDQNSSAGYVSLVLEQKALMAL